MPRFRRAGPRTPAALAAVLLLAGLPAGAAASEEPDASCPVVASAQGVQVMVSASDNLLLEAPAGAAIPVAQACVDYGVRDSTAFASSPYPGQTVILAPGLLSSRTDQEFPGYPAYAASRYPAEEQASAEQPGYQLNARSTETSSQASARSALGAEESGSTQSSARATVDPASEASTATAIADTQPVTINEVLTLGQVHSTATAKVGSDGELERSSRLKIGRTTVGGQEVVITPEGVHAAGQTVPAPEAPPTDALDAAGLKVRYLSAERTPRGVLSAGIEVIARQQDPESGAVTTVHYTFGRSFAAAAPVEEGPGAGTGTIPPVGAGGPVEAPPSSGSADSGPVSDGAVPADSAPATAEVPAGSDGPPPAVAAPDQLVSNPVDMGVTGLYLVLVFGALALFVSGTLLRLLGVKTRWTS